MRIERARIQWLADSNAQWSRCCEDSAGRKFMPRPDNGSWPNPGVGAVGSPERAGPKGFEPRLLVESAFGKYGQRFALMGRLDQPSSDAVSL
jgi:hypothetical protein